MEVPHGELQKHHYQAVHNDLSYRVAGLIESRLDEIEIATPQLPPPPQEEPEWTRGQWDIVRQLQCEVRYLHRKVVEKQANKKRYKTYGEG